MIISLLDDSLQVEISYVAEDAEYEDDICVTITEDCPDDEKIMLAGETNIYLTPEQACTLANELLAAAMQSRRCRGEKE